MTESKWDWSPINRKFYNIEFVSDRDTFKPAGWTREWPDKQTLERNIYEGAVKVTSIDDGKPVFNCSVPLEISQQELVWSNPLHEEVQTVYTDHNGIANFKINPKSGAKIIKIYAEIPVTDRQKNGENVDKMINSSGQTQLKSWISSSDSYIMVKPQKSIHKCDEIPEIKIQYNLLYGFSQGCQQNIFT